jgi:integrase
VDRQLININGREPFFAPPKSQARVRIVPLPRTVVDTLRGHLPLPHREPRVPQAHGQPLRRSGFCTEWRRATRSAGLPDIRFHELRHYYASLLI